MASVSHWSRQIQPRKEERDWLQACALIQFEELQALAAARTKASQDKLAAERAAREAIEREKKLALENKARLDIQKERELLVAREQKRKRDEEQRKQAEVEKKKLKEKREREAKEREKYGMDVVKFRNATEKVSIDFFTSEWSK